MVRLSQCAIVLTAILHVCCAVVDNATAVYLDLLKNYSANTMPKCDSDAAVQVKVGIALRQILDLNEPMQILQSNIWVRLGWKDCRLVWNAAETGVSSLIVPFDQIWSPDVTLYDNAENSLGGAPDFRATVYPDGSVYYYFPSVISTLCKIDVTYFPFDTQRCPLKFGSWSYHGNDLNFTRRDGETSADISAYKENGEWEIAAAPAVRHELYYACCTEPYPDVTFYVTLKRRSRFYLMNLMFPCILMSSLAVLGFLLPPDSGEKVSLEITVLLSLSVFMLIVSETMPPTSETFPFIGMYFACAMLLVSWSCVMTVTVLNLHHRGGRGERMPSWVRTVFLHWLGWFLCFKGYQNAKENKIHSTDSSADEIKLTNVEPDYSRLCGSLKPVLVPKKNSFNNTDRKNSIFAEDGFWKNRHRKKSVFTEDNSWNMNDRKTTMDAGDERGDEIKLMKQQLECIESIQFYLEGQKQTDDVVGEWQLVAKILDRASMIIFFVFQFITTLVIMLNISIDH